MSEVKKFKPGRKVKFRRKNGIEVAGKLDSYWTGGRGEWAKVAVGHAHFNVRPSQLTAV